MLATRRLLIILSAFLLAAALDDSAAQQRPTSSPKPTLAAMLEWCGWALQRNPNIESDDFKSAGRCLGRLEGYALGHQRMAKMSSDQFKICGPDLRKTPPEKLAAILVRWADDHPEERDLDWAVAFHKAMLAAFPCPEKS